MEKDSNTSMVVILIILAVLMYGGSKGANGGGLFAVGPTTPEQKQADIQRQINDAQYKVEELKKQISAEEAKKYESKYKDIIDLSYITRSSQASQEYAVIRANSNLKSPVKISGWKLKSLSSGNSVTIPQGTYLFFAGTVNPEQDIYLSANDTVYINTGISPNGASFKINKCSGYLNQFQTFTPYIGGYCPAPRNENLSSIPRTGYNDSCFDFIDSMSSCRTQTDPLPAGSAKWSVECTDFIYKKINYPACVDTHKNDKDFYQNEWRIFLKRSEPIWKNSRENIVLLDEEGKIVDEYKY